MATRIKQYLRKWSMLINGEPFIDSRDGHQFRVMFDILIKPSTSAMVADIQIYNLSKDTVITQRSDISFSAGYDDNYSVIFNGTITNVMKERHGPDVVTRLFCRGDTAKTRGSMRGAYGFGAHVIDVLRDAARSWPLYLVIDPDQFDEKDIFPSGWTANRDIPTTLNSLAGMFDFTWTVDMGSLVISRINKERTTPVFEINQFTGMVGMPELVGIGEGIGVEVTTRINPFIRADSRINVQSEFTTYQTGNLFFGEMAGDASANGEYNVHSISYFGDTHGQSWGMRILGFRAGSQEPIPISTSGSLVWGSAVTPEFRAKVRQIAAELNLDPNWLMAVMAFETGRAFKAYTKNPKSSATGLIQFIESTARDMGTSTAALANMTEIEQLDWVKKYYQQYASRINNIGDAYMAVFMPNKGIGKPDSYILIDRDTQPAMYNANSGLDKDNSGKITRGEAVERVNEMYKEGQLHMG